MYFLRIANKRYFQNLKKTIDLDYYRVLSYIYFFDTPVYIQSSKKSLYYLYWFKRFLKWLFWFIILAFYPLLYFKYIIWLFIYKHSIKYFFRFIDILMCDILEDVIDVTWLYKPVKKIIKLIFLDFFFYILPLWFFKFCDKFFSRRTWLYVITYIIFKSIDFIFYKILLKIYRKFYKLFKLFFNELKFWRYWSRKIINFPSKIKNKIKNFILYKIKFLILRIYKKIIKKIYYRYFFIIFYKLKIYFLIYKIKEIYFILSFFFIEPVKFSRFFMSIKHFLYIKIYIIFLFNNIIYKILKHKNIIYYYLKYTYLNIKISIFYKYLISLNYMINFYKNWSYNLNLLNTYKIDKYKKIINWLFFDTDYEFSSLYQDRPWFEFKLNNINFKNIKKN